MRKESRDYKSIGLNSKTHEENANTRYIAAGGQVYLALLQVWHTAGEAASPTRDLDQIRYGFD